MEAIIYRKSDKVIVSARHCTSTGDFLTEANTFLRWYCEDNKVTTEEYAVAECNWYGNTLNANGNAVYDEKTNSVVHIPEESTDVGAGTNTVSDGPTLALKTIPVVNPQ